MSHGALARTPDATAGWQLRDRTLWLDRPRIAGILNVTPDSFSDGGNFFSVDSALRHAERMAEDGADVIDVGGESTRPQGAVEVTAEEECRRVLPVIGEIARRLPGMAISVDTVKAGVAAAAMDEGAHIVNDVSGFRLDGRMAETCAARRAGVVLMHSRGTVGDMATYAHAQYRDVVAEVLAELGDCLRAARAGGVPADAIVLDPGIGFSKRTEHSLAVLGGLSRLAALGRPLLVGVSRKRMIGDITGVSEPGERVHGTVGVNVAALIGGARLFRVHDVRESRQALDAAWAVMTASRRTPAAKTALRA